MQTQKPLTLVDPQNGNLAFKIFSYNDDSHFDHVQRNNYYTVIINLSGGGKLKSDFSTYDFSGQVLMCFSPYQPFMINADDDLSGVILNFHPDFFCIHLHQKEVACNGVLFNNIYQPPFITLAEKDIASFLNIIEQMQIEMQNAALAQYELLISYLKIFLINGSRLRVEQSPMASAEISGLKEPFVLQSLKNALEENFKTKHSPAEYADLLNISPKALAKITKNHFNKTLTNMIAERIVIEAKRELYLTSKPVKSIAYELGFNDEFYFSRFFKNNADVSPQLYRETVGFAKAEA
ncbi:helix-turn-helix domain-containing protein [Mucilaginibacter sp. BT774]|uniref:helix-turn-helix domain-containing protein n=1 Tax=Mucilaginibacter sp. BT774 TaxID=3062276 RepID=UPI0026773757|nr:helix-turn-helix domain-containing protein [Mucilaginibacter sp. BT774]MDO3624704.1 helix-turn-helix domain-containing protein [Mucilaginibacter sp. BT774]